MQLYKKNTRRKIVSKVFFSSFTAIAYDHAVALTCQCRHETASSIASWKIKTKYHDTLVYFYSLENVDQESEGEKYF